LVADKVPRLCEGWWNSKQ